MEHTNRKCPHCGKAIRITKYAWKYKMFFWCNNCGIPVKKVYKRWGGITGYVLESI